MFGFEKEEAAKLGSEGRYAVRVEKFRARGDRFPRVKHYFWWVVHNSIAHPLLSLYPCQLTFHYHDWTSVKLNAGIKSLKEFNSAKDSIVD